MKKFALLEKREGETPLEALEHFRRKNKIDPRVPMTYAGRLDPMASGLLLILIGEETKNKEKYLKLGKTYQFEVLFGFATDTYDILGKVTSSKVLTNIRMKDLEKNILENLKYFTGKFKQKYPIYSSKYIKSTRAGEKVKTESREVVARKLEFFKLKSIGSKILLDNIERRIKKVDGDFRQKEILKVWRQKLMPSSKSFFIANFRISCSSGTYVRSIANSLGQKIKIPALAYSIKRTKIGKWGKI